MYPGLLKSSLRSRGYLAVQIAVVDGRCSMDVPGGLRSVVQVIAGMVRVGCCCEELGASHIEMILYREDSCFRVQMGNRGGFSASRSNPQR